MSSIDLTSNAIMSQSKYSVCVPSIVTNQLARNKIISLAGPNQLPSEGKQQEEKKTVPLTNACNPADVSRNKLSALTMFTI